MDWLENARVTEGKETFADIANKVQPALSRAAVGKNDRRAADALAHLGWADFLRSRDGKRGLGPVRYYEQALQRDPDNAYAHAFWGHYLMATDRDVEKGKVHFSKAQASSAQRPFVRGMQISALMWPDRRDLQDEVLRVVNDMRLQGEALPAIAGEPLAYRIWQVYYDHLVRGYGKEDFLGVLPPKDHLATFQWLLQEKYADSGNRFAYLFMLAQFQEHSGDSAKALANYQAVLALLEGNKVTSGNMVDVARAAIRRLQPVS